MPAGEVTTVSAGAGSAGARRSWFDALATPVAFVALLGYPLTLTSPGATVAMILVGLYGLALAARDGLPEDLRRVHRYMLACYLLVVVVDVLNGSIVASLLLTGVDYLPLLALAPFANALRRTSLSSQAFDRAMMATVLIAVAMSGYAVLVRDEYRPGGINLNSIPYAFIVAVWGTFLLARGLAKSANWPLLIGAALALGPTLMAKGKTVLVCIVVGYLVVGLLWAAENRRWKALWIGAALGILAAGFAFYLVAAPRLDDLSVAFSRLAFHGELGVGSLGERYELVISGWRAFLERPILGYGLNERMQVVFDHLGPVDVRANTAGHLHNDYITHMVSFGVFGLVFLVGYFALTCRLVVRSGDIAYQRAGIALLCMLMIYMTAEVAFNMDPISSLVTLAFGVVLSRAPETPVAADGGVIDGKSTKPV